MSHPARAARTARPRNRHRRHPNPSPGPGDAEALRGSINSHTGGLHCSVTSHASRDGDGEFDLGRNYQNAIDCLVQCDAVIRSLEGRLAAREQELDARDAELALKDEELASKDDKIASLEEKTVRMSLDRDLDARDAELASKDGEIARLEERVVRMSLELATARAFEDAHRSTRRTCDLDDEEGSDDDLYPAPLPEGRAGGGAPLDISVVKKATTRADRRRHSVSVLSSDTATTRTSFSSFNNSNSSLGQFFRGNQLFRGGNRGGGGQGAPPKDDAEEGEAAGGGTEGTEGTERGGDGGGRPPAPPGRRPGRPRIEERTSLKKFLEAGTVVFPSSFEEVLTKGCLEVPDSLKKLSGDTDWSEMLREVE